MNPLRGPDVLGMVPIRFSFDSGTSREQTIDSHALRSRAKRGVSKDGPGGGDPGAPGSALRGRFAAPQGEGRGRSSAVSGHGKIDGSMSFCFTEAIVAKKRNGRNGRIVRAPRPPPGPLETDRTSRASQSLTR